MRKGNALYGPTRGHAERQFDTRPRNAGGHRRNHRLHVQVPGADQQGGFRAFRFAENGYPSWVYAGLGTKESETAIEGLKRHCHQMCWGTGTPEVAQLEYIES